MFHSFSYILKRGGGGASYTLCQSYDHGKHFKPNLIFDESLPEVLHSFGKDRQKLDESLNFWRSQAVYFTIAKRLEKKL